MLLSFGGIYIGPSEIINEGIPNNNEINKIIYDLIENIIIYIEKNYTKEKGK